MDVNCTLSFFIEGVDEQTLVAFIIAGMFLSMSVLLILAGMYLTRIASVYFTCIHINLIV